MTKKNPRYSSAKPHTAAPKVAEPEQPITKVDQLQSQTPAKSPFFEDLVFEFLDTLKKTDPQAVDSFLSFLE